MKKIYLIGKIIQYSNFVKPRLFDQVWLLDAQQCGNPLQNLDMVILSKLG